MMHECGTFVTKDEPILVDDCYQQSIVCSRTTLMREVDSRVIVRGCA